MSTAPSASQPILARPGLPPQTSSQFTTSHNTSAYQSYSSMTSLSSSNSTASAPLPSPSSSYPPQQSFFGSLNQHEAQSQPQSQTQQSTGQQQTQQGQSHEDYRPNREGAGRTATETNNFLMAEALLAEAAKRAQMHVVMRDIEGMEL